MRRSEEVPSPPGSATARDPKDWRLRAACRYLTDPDLFFPLSAAGPSQPQIAQAKAVCAVCPVSAQCLEFARRTRQQHGIWGGLTDDERRAAFWPEGGRARSRSQGLVIGIPRSRRPA
jgi:WhiB family transcriptional regulator, redox-sensing transcriptional regulator